MASFCFTGVTFGFYYQRMLVVQLTLLSTVLQVMKCSAIQETNLSYAISILALRDM
jgi:hypothetical protein